MQVNLPVVGNECTSSSTKQFIFDLGGHDTVLEGTLVRISQGRYVPSATETRISNRTLASSKDPTPAT